MSGVLTPSWDVVSIPRRNESFLHQCAFPRIMIRVGAMPTAATPLHSTPRHPVDEVIELN